MSKNLAGGSVCCFDLLLSEVLFGYVISKLFPFCSTYFSIKPFMLGIFYFMYFLLLAPVVLYVMNSQQELQLLVLTILISFHINYSS